jgi:hypothetical protein
VKRAEEKVLKERVVATKPKDPRGRKAVVEPFSVFLLVFMYVHGGVREFEAPFLPGVFCSQSQFSCLLDNAASVVFQKWGKLYYEKRGLDWLRLNATSDTERSQYQKERKFDETLQKADVVLLLDGCAVPCEKSQGLREQKECFDWSKDERQEIRFLVLVNLNGEVVELSKAVGGRKFECEVATDMRFLERWEEEAVQKNYEGFHIHLVVDRGFYDFKRWVDAREWKKLVITIEHPSFLNPVKHRGERYTAEEKKNKRKKFGAEEAERNREIAGERWVNEWAVGALEHARLLKRRLDLSIMPNMNDFLGIAAAQVNYRLRMKQNKTANV